MMVILRNTRTNDVALYSVPTVRLAVKHWDLSARVDLCLQ